MVEAMFGLSGSVMPGKALARETARISVKAALGDGQCSSLSFGTALRAQLIRTKRSGRVDGARRSSCCRYSANRRSARAASKVGELVITVYLRSWWMTSLPSRYSKMALSPLASASDRCPPAAAPFGSVGATMAKGPLASASTASATVAKLSSAYCVQSADRDQRLSGRLGVAGSVRSIELWREAGVVMPSTVARLQDAITEPCLRSR